MKASLAALQALLVARASASAASLSASALSSSGARLSSTLVAVSSKSAAESSASLAVSSSAAVPSSASASASAIRSTSTLASSVISASSASLASSSAATSASAVPSSAIPSSASASASGSASASLSSASLPASPSSSPYISTLDAPLASDLGPHAPFPAAPSELFSPLVPLKLSRTGSNSSEFAQSNFPQYTTRDTGEWVWFGADTWTSGFLPATFYEMHRRQGLCPAAASVQGGDENWGGGGGGGKGDVDWLDLGRAWSTNEIPLEINTGVGHDRGFLSFPFVDELAVNPRNATAIQAVNAFAAGLAARFSPIVGCTRSWDTADPTDFQVIIDNMMNLEVLFVSEALTGNHTLRHIAISHANKTMINHFRPDGSTYHLVEYNSTTGAVIDRKTVQGYADWSCWSRGQSWAIYGFANMYKRTRIDDFLDTARHAADYFLGHLPPNGVVPWDFNAPLDPPRPADTSAAMIAVNGLLLLAQQELVAVPPNPSAAIRWTTSAMQLLEDNTRLGWRPEWQSLLANGTVNNPASPPNNLTGIVYGDYYFVKAGNDLVQAGLAQC